MSNVIVHDAMCPMASDCWDQVDGQARDHRVDYAANSACIDCHQSCRCHMIGLVRADERDRCVMVFQRAMKTLMDSPRNLNGRC